jgi:cytochrome c-type biogenesis protein CcmF
MTALWGNSVLGLTLLASAATMLAAFGAALLKSDSMQRWARLGVVAVATLLTVASTILVTALVRSDFSMAYVVSYTELALPIGYKLTAFWAGQQGSLLLWAWAMAIMGVIFIVTRRGDSGRAHAVAILALTSIVGFFVALMLYDPANPFLASAQVVTDGHGLNPMLQNIGMIAHPPTLFLGYAGFTIPFAMMVGALAAGKVDGGWVEHSRRWIIASWLLLTVGILLGAQWAYVELGWGGYWAWDPVENASLLPWLTATALMHSLMAQQHRGMFKTWNVSLMSLTFLLCIFGTYLTRSGVVQSVHAFEKSLIGWFFLSFLALCVVACLVLIVMRRRELGYGRRMEDVVSREGGFLAGNALLVGMMVLITGGTLCPLVAKRVLGVAFYNVSILPLMVMLAAVMAVGPVLGYGRADRRKLMGDLAIPVAAGIAVALGLGFVGVLHGWTVKTLVWTFAAGLVVTTAIMGILADLVRCVVVRVSRRGENPVRAAVVMIDGNHRRYGGHLVHLGVALVIAGVAGSGLFKSQQDVSLKTGEAVQVGGYTLTLNSIEEVRGENYRGMQATLAAANGQGVQEDVLRPQMRIYDKYDEQRNAEIALHWGLARDLYVNFAGLSEDGRTAGFQIMVNPLVTWIWIGGIVMALGGLFCLLPRLLPVEQEETAREVSEGAVVAGEAIEAAS